MRTACRSPKPLPLAKRQGDHNMLSGMTAICDIMAANLNAIHAGSLPADTAKGIAADVQRQLDFRVEGCVLEPEVDGQFQIVLAQVMDGVPSLEAGKVEPSPIISSQSAESAPQVTGHCDRV